MGKINCWEFNKCGREPGGSNAAEFGVCPVTTCQIADDFCGGINGGRSCSFLSKLLFLDCNEAKRLSEKDILIDKKAGWCEGCRFYEILKDECGEEFSLSNLKKFLARNKK